MHKSKNYSPNLSPKLRKLDVPFVRIKKRLGQNQAFDKLAYLPKQSQYTLWQLVRLRNHGSACLLQDLSARKVRRFHCEVCIHDSTASSLLVF